MKSRKKEMNKQTGEVACSRGFCSVDDNTFCEISPCLFWEGFFLFCIALARFSLVLSPCLVFSFPEILSSVCSVMYLENNK